LDRPIRRSLLSRTAFAVILLTTACGGDQGANVPAGVIGDSAGIRVVDLTGVPTIPTRAVGVDEGWLESFDLDVGRLGDVVPLAEGGAVILDEMAGTVFVLDAGGRVVLEFGRLGEGPGEFSPHGGISRVLATDSSFLVPDIQLQRITEFSMDGEVLSIKTMPGSDPEEGPVFGVDWRGHPEGGIIFRALHPEGDRILWSRGGGVETLHVFDIPWPSGNQLLPPTALWDVDREGDLVLGRSDRGRVERRATDVGAPRWVTRWEDDGGELTTRDRTHLEDLLVLAAEEQGLGSIPVEERERILSSVTLPDSVPVVASVLADERGRTWVQGATSIPEMGLEAMRVGSSAGFGGSEWRVLGPDGTLEEVVSLPRGFTPRGFVGDCMFGILEDDLGVQRPARVCVD
jgi:hypothetical protein